MNPSAAIYGCAGPVLTAEERAFFRDADPLGFILFARNCVAPDQLRALVHELRACVDRADAPVLIDQEGGRVQRLKPPHWRAAPPAARFGELFRRDPAAGRRAARLNGLAIGGELAALGIDVDCVPVLDVPVPGAHDVIGDRAFAADAAVVAELGRAMAEGLMAAGVLPVIKHVPGHGRAQVDSHHALPRVDTPAHLLRQTDFVPFKALADHPWAMTAHVLYTDIDPDRPATTSPAIIERVIRGWMGFQGLLLSDDLSMNALGGSLGERARAALAAGCDVALHCNGRLDEMRAVAETAGPLSPRGLARVADGRRRLPATPAAAAIAQAAAAECEGLLGAVA